MRALKFITGHVIYNSAYTYKFQLKTTQDNLISFKKGKRVAKQSSLFFSLWHPSSFLRVRRTLRLQESFPLYPSFNCILILFYRFLLKALDMYWHEDCLKCGCCDCRLGEVGSTLYTKGNLLLCRRDYLRYVSYNYRTRTIISVASVVEFCGRELTGA